MLDLNNPVDKKAFDELHGYAHTMTGTNFALAMRNPDGSVTVYPRQNQPCQGGEMRKYYKTHGDRCTRPKDPRPSDLHKPFPDGVVEGVSLNLGNKSHSMEFAKFLFSSESPYRKAFPSSEDVHFIPSKYDPEMLQGIIVTNTDIDPTVFVNSLQCFRTLSESTWKKYVDLGLTKLEAVVTQMLSHNDISAIVGETYTYYFPMNASIRRLMEGDPFDLSGGTWRDGFDYNRPEIQDLFKAREGEKATIFAKELQKFAVEKSFGDPRYPQYMSKRKIIEEDKIVSVVRGIFEKALRPNDPVKIEVDIPNPKAEAKKPRKTVKKVAKKEAA